jgi:hypothetical protein
VRIEQLQTLYDCSQWATGSVLDAADNLGAHQFVTPGPVPFTGLKMNGTRESGWKAHPVPSLSISRSSLWLGRYESPGIPRCSQCGIFCLDLAMLILIPGSMSVRAGVFRLERRSITAQTD